MLHLAATSQGSPSVQTARLDLPPSLPAALPRFSAVLHGGADAVRSLLAAAGPGTRVVRVGNPLRAPLTIERILIQSGQMEAGLLTDDAADQAMHRLCHRRDGESRVLLAIDQAETLSPAALRTLVRIAAPSGPPRPPQGGLQADLHVVFIGTPAFAALLSAPGLEPLRDALPHLVGQAGAAPTLDPGPPQAPPILSDPAGVQPILAGTAVAAAPLDAPPQLDRPPVHTVPEQAKPLLPLAPTPDPVPGPARHLSMMADLMPPGSPPPGVNPPAPAAVPKPVPASATPCKHLAMMANVMAGRAAPENAAPPPMSEAAIMAGPLPPAAPPRPAATVVPAVLPGVTHAPRRGRSRALVALLLLAVLGVLAFVVATRPDLQELLGIQGLVGQLEDAVRRLRV